MRKTVGKVDLGDDQELGRVKFKMPISHPSEFVILCLDSNAVYQAGVKVLEVIQSVGGI